MPVVEVTEWIDSDPDQVYAKISRMEDFPAIMANVQSVTIKETGEGYTLSEWVAKLQGARFRWVERDEFFPEHRRITFRQTEGDLKVFQGEWRVVSDGQRSQVTFVTEFEFGMPMLSNLLNPVARYALRQNARSMVQGIQQALAAHSG
ncbi:MAG: SRPBCC family protein [Firmicutes bacterium]|jgi:ribosome-associated toxin RatA of RatAB toxin-antitoxin module|nr:SRPBCC family protein [Bacillota bacterium]